MEKFSYQVIKVCTVIIQINWVILQVEENLAREQVPDPQPLSNVWMDNYQKLLIRAKNPTNIFQI